jgi:putative DNA primase/helicase
MACALWVLFTHSHDAWQISPQLLVTSPQPECGKTTLLETLAALCPKSLMLVSITPATLFRLADKYHPSMFLDEDDAQNKELLDLLRGIMNAGHRKNSAVVPRVEGDKNREVQLYSLWTPKAIARIGVEGVHATQVGRSIQVAMRRMTKDEKKGIEKLPRDPRKAFEVLRRRCARWANDNFAKLVDATPKLPSELGDRAQDNWEPLLAIADLCGQGELARDCAISLSGKNRRDTTGEMLLGDIKELFDEFDETELTSAEIVEALGKREDRPWSEFYRGKPISARGVARLLEPFGIRPRQLYESKLQSLGSGICPVRAHPRRLRRPIMVSTPDFRRNPPFYARV